MSKTCDAADWLAELIGDRLPLTGELVVVRYSSGVALWVPKLGWYAVWESTDLIEGPFPALEGVEACFLGEDDQ